MSKGLGCLQAFALAVSTSLNKLLYPLPYWLLLSPSGPLQARRPSLTPPLFKIASSWSSPCVYFLCSCYYHLTCKGLDLSIFLLPVSSYFHQGWDVVCPQPHFHVLVQGLTHSRCSIMCCRNGSQEAGGMTLPFYRRGNRGSERTAKESRLQSTSLARVQVAP